MGGIPLTASKTDAETNATTRVVARGLVLPVITVSLIIPIHCSTGSGTAAVAEMGLTAIRPASKVISNNGLVAGRIRFLRNILPPFQNGFQTFNSLWVS